MNYKKRSKVREEVLCTFQLIRLGRTLILQIVDKAPVTKKKLNKASK